MTTDEKLDAVLSMVSELHATVADIQEKINGVIPEVKPAVDALMSSPLIRMMTGGKRK